MNNTNIFGSKQVDETTTELQHKLRSTLYATLCSLPNEKVEVLKTAADAIGFVLGLCFDEGHEEILKELVVAMAQQTAHKLQCSVEMKETIVSVMEQTKNANNLLNVFKKGTNSNRFVGAGVKNKYARRNNRY